MLNAAMNISDSEDQKFVHLWSDFENLDFENSDDIDKIVLKQKKSKSATDNIYALCHAAILRDIFHFGGGLPKLDLIIRSSSYKNRNQPPILHILSVAPRSSETFFTLEEEDNRN